MPNEIGIQSKWTNCQTTDEGVLLQVPYGFYATGVIGVTGQAAGRSHWVSREIAVIRSSSAQARLSSPAPPAQHDPQPPPPPSQSNKPKSGKSILMDVSTCVQLTTQNDGRSQRHGIRGWPRPSEPKACQATCRPFGPCGGWGWNFPAAYAAGYTRCRPVGPCHRHSPPAQPRARAFIRGTCYALLRANAQV